MEGGAVGHNIEKGPSNHHLSASLYYEIKITSKSFAQKFELK
jgi:hypothetical protein